MRYFLPFRITFLSCLLIIASFTSGGQSLLKKPDTNLFIRKELNTGIKFSSAPEREELLTDLSRFSTDQTLGKAVLEFFGNTMIYLPSRQETWNYFLELGPYSGNGDITDSTAIEFINADISPKGLRGRLGAEYSSRFYWDKNSYTIVSLNAWGQYDRFKYKAKGTVIDSNNVAQPFEDSSGRSKFRYGFNAKAGWGFGRFIIMNHIAAAQWLLEKHYPGRNFSEEEIALVAREIGRIKHQRKLQAGHSSENEAALLNKFINTHLLLEPSQSPENDWELTEFRPRFQGSRIETGPFFDYFNREPDFIYGGYINYENQKYCSRKLNRMYSAGLRYNGYKKQDWITFQAITGWNWYPGLKHEIGFGLRYLPGMMINDFDYLKSVRHALIPYLEYFTQLGRDFRIETSLAFRIAKKDEFIMPGPEFSLSVYRSRY